MTDLKKENLLNREPADMHSDGVRFQDKKLAEKEEKERAKDEAEKILKEKKPSK